jgi:hypothetical protein
MSGTALYLEPEKRFLILPCYLHLLDLRPYFGFDLIRHFRVIDQQLLNRISSLAHFIGIIAEPASAFLYDAKFNNHINDLTNFGDTFSINDVELCLAERRGYFILNHFYLYMVAYRFIAVLYL